MAKETQVGQLVIDLKIKTEALEKGLEIAKKKLREIENENKSIENSNKNLESSWVAVAATAGIALAGIISSIKSATEEYKAHEQAMSSLQNVSDYTGESISDLSDIMEKYEGIMTKTDLATTIKNFTLMGYSAKDTEKMIESLTNSAIRNRNANYTVSEAVRVASEGYRQGLSTLSDSAGVTENLSVMLDNYAKSIGKTASQLTEAEKNQAYLNRTMYAAEPFAGAMESYLDSLAGKQGQYSQAMRETQVAYIESIEPLLIKFEEFKTKIITNIGDIISTNQTATIGITTFGVAMLSLGTLFTIGIKGVQLYKKAIDALNVSSATLKSTMTGMLVFSAVIAGITALTTAIQENEEATAKLEEITRRYNEVKNGTFEYTDKNIASLEKDKKAIEEQIELYNKIGDAQKEYNELSEFSKGNYWLDRAGALEVCEDGTIKLKKSAYELKQEIKAAEKAFKEAQKTNGNYGNSLEELQEKQNENIEALKKADAIKNISKSIDIEKIKKQQQESAQLKINAQNMKEYLNIVKQGNKSSTQYQDAVKALAKAYPEASTAGGLLIDVLDGLINAEQLQADESWNASQTAIQGHIENIQQAINDQNVQRQVAANMGVAYDENFKPKLETILQLLQLIGAYTPDEVPNITPTSVTRKSYGSSSKTYQNKRLDNYKKEIEHKKALDQLSLQQEISMYQTALNKYAKKQDEKWELTEKIYELQKELQEKSLDDYISMIEHRKALDQISLQDEINMYQYAYNSLAKTTEQKQELEEKLYELRKELAQKNKDLLEQETKDYQRYIEDQKNIRGAEYDSKEQEQDLDKIISLHKNYLNQIMKDERLSLDERKELYEEELDTIRDYEQQKRDLRVQAVDDTVSKLTSAITKQLEEMQEADKKAIEDNIQLVEKWKEARVNAINEEYNTRIEAIQKELDLLDKSEEDKTRAEEDAEYQRKKSRFEDLIAYEHDATTKANYQKELDKLVAEYQKTLDKRALSDKKEALNAQKELLKEEQDDKVQKIEDEADKQKEQYENQLDELEKYYDKQKELAQETAEKMLLNVDQNQNKILELLKSYGDAYEITGQSLGEKLAQGINNGIADKIQNIIQKIQDTIDAGIENKIRGWTSGMYKYEAGANKPKTQTINVYQTNNIEQNPEMPSETYRKLRNIDEQLASSLAGM